MYAKLFRQMYHGTLATDGPWEALVTFQQLLILADKDGVVDMTQKAIARETTIPLEIITQGIDVLEQPDPESRTPDEDGRRIVKLSEHRNWGWRITNYSKYRQLQREEDRRAYHRSYWHKRKHDSTETQHTQPTQPNSPIAEAYAEAEAEAHVRASDVDVGWKTKERCAAIYPAGTYRGTSWITAERQIGKLLDAGEDAEEIVARTAEYSAQCIAKGSVGTQFVLSPAKFYVDEWRGPFPIPKKQETREEATARKFLAGEI